MNTVQTTRDSVISQYRDNIAKVREAAEAAMANEGDTFRFVVAGVERDGTMSHGLTLGDISKRAGQPSGAIGFEFRLDPTTYSRMGADSMARRWNNANGEMHPVKVMTQREYFASYIKAMEDSLAFILGLIDNGDECEAAQANVRG